MLSASDLDLWARASAHDVGGIGPSLTFAIACETVAVASILAPLGLLFGVLVHQLTHDFRLLGAIAGLTGRLAAVFIPVMIIIHVVYQWTLARAGGRLGSPISRAAALRAGLYACGWDLATGPAGVLASLFSGELREARKRARGNSTLFRDAATEWLRHAHGLEGPAADPARKAPSRSMAFLVLVAVTLSGWAFVASFAR